MKSRDADILMVADDSVEERRKRVIRYLSECSSVVSCGLGILGCRADGCSTRAKLQDARNCWIQWYFAHDEKIEQHRMVGGSALVAETGGAAASHSASAIGWRRPRAKNNHLSCSLQRLQCHTEYFRLLRPGGALNIQPVSHWLVSQPLHECGKAAT